MANLRLKDVELLQRVFSAATPLDNAGEGTAPIPVERTQLIDAIKRAEGKIFKQRVEGEIHLFASFNTKTVPLPRKTINFEQNQIPLGNLCGDLLEHNREKISNLELAHT